MKRPAESLILYLLLAFLSISGIYGGTSLILAPDGSRLGMEPGWLDGSPFGNFSVPGILLWILIGLFPLLTLTGLLFRFSSRFLNGLNIYRDKHWSWTCSLYSGVITLSWIIIQQFVTRYFILQPVIASAGLLIVILTLLPRIQAFYKHSTRI